MSAEQLDQEMLSTLTEEEREAVAGSDYTPEELAAIKAVAGVNVDDDDDDPDDPDAGGGEPGGIPGAEPTALQNKVDPAPHASTEETEGGDVVPELRPRYNAELPSDYADNVAAIKAESDELAAQFRDGTIDIDEFQLKSQEIAGRRDDLVVQRTKAEISSEMSTQSATQQWEGAVSKFVQGSANQPIDYNTNAAALEDLDQFVRVLSNKPEHENKSGDWFLKEAHKRVLALHGVDDPGPVPTLPKTPEKPAARKASVASIPKTLAQVPGSDGVGDLAGEFADIENLEGFEIEQAIHRMTLVQRERYAAGR